jgi:glycosyltransferase involved in cell wall biosynthesis
MSSSLLIISSAHLCRNPRVYKEAVTLGQAGYAVTVLTVSNHAPSEALDRQLLAGAPFRRVVIDHLARRGPAAARAWCDRAVTRLARAAVPRLHIETPAALGPARRLLAAARRLPADLTIVHCEAPAWVGLRLLDDGRRVAADFEDWYSEDLLPADRRHRPLKLLRAVEHGLLHRAHYVSNTSHAMAAALHARYGGTAPAVIRNVFPLPPPPPPRPPDRPPIFVWLSQTVGPGRGLEAFLDAWVNLPQSSEVRLLGQVSPEYRAALLARLPAQRQRALRFDPPLPPPALPAYLAQADVGLALEPSEPPSRDLTTTNKIFYYLGAGLAVLATPTAGQREVFAAAPAIGWLNDLSNRAAGAALLARICADRDGLRRAQAQARAAAEIAFRWEIEAPRLLELVRAALSR